MDTSPRNAKHTHNVRKSMFGEKFPHIDLYAFGAIISALTILIAKLVNYGTEAWKVKYTVDTDLKRHELDDSTKMREEFWDEYNRLKKDFIDTVERYRKMQDSFLEMTRKLESVQEQYRQVIQEKHELEVTYGELLKRYEKAMKEIELFRGKGEHAYKDAAKGGDLT